MLTAREREILQLLAEGKISKEVAALFDLSIKTVQTHCTNRIAQAQLPLHRRVGPIMPCATISWRPRSGLSVKGN
jgi:DNA-binding CsgD family transcriptional regulator